MSRERSTSEEGGGGGPGKSLVMLNLKGGRSPSNKRISKEITGGQIEEGKITARSEVYS
jgi:hypothetical protein